MNNKDKMHDSLINYIKNHRDFSVVTLSGSTRFKDSFEIATKELTLLGKIVLPLGVYSNPSDTVSDDKLKMLTAMHYQKINMCDEMFVINPNGYIGDHTKEEIEYATEIAKPIYYLVNVGASDVFLKQLCANGELTKYNSFCKLQMDCGQIYFSLTDSIFNIHCILIKDEFKRQGTLTWFVDTAFNAGINHVIMENVCTDESIKATDALGFKECQPTMSSIFMYNNRIKSRDIYKRGYIIQ